jgi:hypothetical protein
MKAHRDFQASPTTDALSQSFGFRYALLPILPENGCPDPPGDPLHHWRQPGQTQYLNSEHAARRLHFPKDLLRQQISITYFSDDAITWISFQNLSKG